MFSLPQNLINEIKNIIDTTYLQEFVKINLNLSNYILFCYDKSKYIKNILNYENDVANLYITTLKKAIPLIDDLFCNSLYRKSNFYISKRNIPRDRELYFGALYYKRNYYCNKDKINGFYFIDELLGFEKYFCYDPIIRGLTISSAVDTNANMVSKNPLTNHYSILDTLNKNKNSQRTIPRQTIYNWIKKWVIPQINYKTIPTGKVLYVMADEKWIHKQIKKELKKKLKEGLAKHTQEELDSYKEQLNKKSYIMSKCFIIFTGAKTKNGRTQLLGRHIFVTSSKTPYEDLMKEICKIYDFEKIETINLLSDAGSWILASKDELKLFPNNKIVVNTCEFHVSQKVHRMIRDKELNELLLLDIYTYEDKEDFKKMVDLVIEKRPNRKEKIIEYRDYILKYWKSILNMKNCDIKSSMESHISHYVANQFGSRPKGYSDKNIEQYLKLETLKNNGFNILDLYLKSYGIKNPIYNENELDFSLFDKSSSNIPVCTTKNPISLIVNSIANKTTF